ncbi:MAG: hypothetical protein EOS56_22955 [Mesorhizobium sp.]|nr:MAG: hypothetical protein EOS56_22955 [Mesorhizobium sp.]RWC59340.1 MAG: hypothetical protein EOS29_22140 [Mesorhizobium sp.]
MPAGILSPYGDGERGTLIADFANHQRCKKRAEVAASFLLPVTIRGEVPGRAMRGGASFDNWWSRTPGDRRRHISAPRT